MIKSQLFKTERVENLAHKFGEDTQYFPVKVSLNTSEVLPAYFTRHQILDAILRASKNQEDVRLHFGDELVSSIKAWLERVASE